MGLSAKYTSSRRVSLRSDWYADAYWLVDAYVRFSGEAMKHDVLEPDATIHSERRVFGVVPREDFHAGQRSMMCAQ